MPARWSTRLPAAASAGIAVALSLVAHFTLVSQSALPLYQFAKETTPPNHPTTNHLTINQRSAGTLRSLTAVPKGSFAQGAAQGGSLRASLGAERALARQVG